jgi:hypothetical protein
MNPGRTFVHGVYHALRYRLGGYGAVFPDSRNFSYQLSKSQRKLLGGPIFCSFTGQYGGA